MHGFCAHPSNSIKQLSPCPCVHPLQIGDVIEGVVQSMRPYGVFLRLPNGTFGMLHISQITCTRIERLSVLTLAELFRVGDHVKASGQGGEGRGGTGCISRWQPFQVARTSVQALPGTIEWCYSTILCCSRLWCSTRTNKAALHCLPGCSSRHRATCSRTRSSCMTRLRRWVWPSGRSRGGRKEG
jgi:hypothetical protein